MVWVAGRSDATGAVETSRQFDLRSLDNCRTVLHCDTSAGGGRSQSYLSYTGVPWTLRIRKEVLVGRIVEKTCT